MNYRDQKCWENKFKIKISSSATMNFLNVITHLHKPAREIWDCSGFWHLFFGFQPCTAPLTNELANVGGDSVAYVEPGIPARISISLAWLRIVDVKIWPEIPESMLVANPQGFGSGHYSFGWSLRFWLRELIIGKSLGFWLRELFIWQILQVLAQNIIHLAHP